MAVTARLVSPLPGAVCFPYDAGGSGNVGDAVYLAADGDVEVSDDDVGSGAEQAIGVVVAAGTFGAVAFVAGDRLSVCRYGPVAGFGSQTPAALAYVSDSGAIAESAGTNSRVIGRFDSAEVLFINPPA